MPAMKFYIVTPAYNALQWLQGCVRSIADQVCETVEVHHHVQDGGSTDGTQAWLESWQKEHADTPGYKLTYESGKDAGLYDAINIGWKKLPDDADVVAHLNADEQYLPDVLASVAERVAANPEVDIFTTAHLVLDKDLRYICHRCPAFPNKIVSCAICQLITNTCFYQASAFRKRSIYFNTSYRSLGDLIYFRDVLSSGVRVLRLPQLLGSVFVVTGNNVSGAVISETERRQIRADLPFILRLLIPVFIKGNNFLCMLSDVMNRSPREYAVYAREDRQRTVYGIKHPTHRWGGRSVGEA